MRIDNLTDMKEPDLVNVPAYQRKRSLAAKARKRSTAEKLATPRKKAVRKTASRPVTTQRPLSSRPRYSDDLLIEDVLTDIPAHEPIHTIDEFPEPETAYSPASSSTREMKLVGRCDGYFEKIDVAIVKLTSPMRTGDQLIFQKVSGLFEQPVDSMQIDRKDVQIAHSGDDVGLKVIMEPKVGGLVYKVI